MSVAELAGYRKTVLPNGLRLVTERIPHVRSVAVGVWVDTGSRDEPAGRSGISHFIEHLVFKGTETRSAEEIARAVDSVGGQMDAFTTKEQTCFYVTVLDEHLPMAADLLADILRFPRFATEDIEREKTVVLQEFRMVDDDPADVVHDRFAERVWPGHPLGRPILGDRKLVMGLDRDTVCSHFETEYRPDRIVVAAAGNLRHAQLEDLLGSPLAGLSGVGATRNGSPPVASSPVELIDKPLEAVHLVLGAAGLAHDDPARYALYLLNAALGGGMSSRLFQEIRERRGLVYEIHSGTDAFRDSGLFYVYAGAEPRHFHEVVTLALASLARVRAEGLGIDELERAKAHLKGSLMLSLESTSSRMSRIARQELYFGRPFTLDEILGSIDRVTGSEVHALAARLLGAGSLSLVAMGPAGPETTLPSRLAL